ncbi:pilus assembly protein TadG-related protein [Tsuneonella sp. HG222]
MKLHPSLHGFVARLARDTAGNTLAMIAAAMVPLLAIVGGGVDVSRGYLAQSRLQQACDAGVLAARKRMGRNIVAGVLSGDARNAGQNFFEVNFGNGIYGTQSRTFDMTVQPDFTIGGIATVVVPTTIMNIFGYTQIPLRAECGAQLSMSNTDVMMVLDTTGSMNSTNPGDSKTKMEALKDVVRSFHATLGAAASPATRIRFGFVPYSTNVNVGHLLQEDWFAKDVEYNTREPITLLGANLWHYDKISVDTRFLWSGTPTKQFNIGGTAGSPSPLTVGWDGCIEERDTYEITDYTNVDLTRALDLDIDTVPNPARPATLWKPLIADLSFARGMGAAPNLFNIAALDTDSQYLNPNWHGYAACPAKAQKLAPMTAAQVDSYLSTLSAYGNTYHDIGMIWGGRLLSPTGIFAPDNADLAGQPTSRNIIFLTDGQTAPLDISYSSYGIEGLDGKRWRPTSPLTLTQTVERRFSFACEEVKKKNITVWVIAFGTNLNPMLTTCAGNGHYFEAADAISLEQAFQKIARQIGDLRLSK